jgi:ribosomal protein S18 acetylase RimI-like enzyme
MEAKVVVLGPQHKEAKKYFKCGNDILNNYLAHFALHDQQKKLSVCFVLESPSQEIIGYYTLSASSIDAKNTSDQRFIPFKTKYRTLPIILIGRFAIDLNYKRKGFGKKLLSDALKRFTLQANQIGACAVFVEPKDATAREFYLKFGFKNLPDQSQLFISMQQLHQIYIVFH